MTKIYTTCAICEELIEECNEDEYPIITQSDGRICSGCASKVQILISTM